MDLSTTYLGLKLKNPLVASASPLTGEVDTVRRLEDVGAAAVVMPSLFEEQLRHEADELHHFMEHGTESHAESLTYFPDAPSYDMGPESYLDLIARLKEAVDIPVIASLNGTSRGGWSSIASAIEQAGADALELNVYYVATDPDISGGAVEQRYLDVLGEVRRQVTIPVAVKVSPYFSSMAAMARQLVAAGADGLVLFNRFYQPDIDLEELEVVPNLQLSSAWECRLPMRWIAILYGRIQASLAATSGIHTSADVLKMLMAGADVTMLCSALLIGGLERVARILQAMRDWMDQFEYISVSQMKGSMSQRTCPDPAQFERANYMKVLHSFR